MSRLPASIAPGLNEHVDAPDAPPTAPPPGPPSEVENARMASFPSAAPGAPTAQLPADAPPTTPLDAGVNAVDALQPGVLGDGVRILSEEDVMQDLMKDDLRLPISVLSIALCAAIGINAGTVWGELGATGAAMVGIAAIVSVAFGVLINTPSAWLVGKMFNADFGSFGSLAVRVAAVCSAQTLVGALIPPLFALIVGLPVFIVLAVWLIGIDFFQAFVLAVVATIANILLGAFIIGSLGAMMMASM